MKTFLQQLATYMLCFLVTSCASSNLFEGANAYQKYTLATNTPSFKQTPTIRSGDKITISIWGHQELSIGSINTPFSSNESTGRWVLVDIAGEVNLPKIGHIRLEGLTIKEANYTLEQAYSKHLINPIINVRVLNHYITVLGEINLPGRYELNNEKMSLVQLIGQAQGFTNYAATKKIKIIRQIDTEIKEFTIDFEAFSALYEHNVILKPDDVVYIPAKKGKQMDKFLKKATPIAAIVSSAAVVTSIFFMRR